MLDQFQSNAPSFIPGIKVRYFGVSNMRVSMIRLLQRTLPDQLAVNQLEMSQAHLDCLDQGVHVNQKAGVAVNFGEGPMEYWQTENIQLQVWGPLVQGRFSGCSVESEDDNIRKTAELVNQMAARKNSTPEAIILG